MLPSSASNIVNRLLSMATQLGYSFIMSRKRSFNTLCHMYASNFMFSIEPISPRITQTGKDLKIKQFVRLSEAVGGNILCRDGIYLELTCSVEGLPTPKVTWLRGSTKIGTGRKLSLGILQEESSGNYTCLAANIAGDTRKTTRLTVRCKYNIGYNSHSDRNLSVNFFYYQQIVVKDI